MRLNILIDTGFWIALYDPRENLQFAQEANRIAEEIIKGNIIIPFPTLYEFVNSRFSRKDSRIQFENLLKKPNVILLSDHKYKEEALDNFFIKSKQKYNDISLVDEIIKLIISDPDVKIDYIVSFDNIIVNEAMAKGIKKI